ncbi:MAG TPA: MFS transporter, partial [Actinomycetota bacterium]|nr:MFS transporter [Actinomycetota bacterium]
TTPHLPTPYRDGMEPEQPRVAPGRARGALRAIAVDITPFRVSEDYRRVWWAELLSQIGSQITVVAVFIQVYQLTNSAAAVGVVGIVQLVPLALATIVGGPLIDRLDRRKILLSMQAGLVAMSGLLLLGSTLHRTPLWLVYLPVGLAAGFSGVASPTRGAIVPNLIPLGLLSSAVALNQIMWNAAMVAGPAVGGVIIGLSKTHGLTYAYAVDVASFAATIYVTFRLPEQIPKRHDEHPSTGARAIRDAFTFLRGKRVLQATFVVDLVAMIFGMPRALFPILAIKQFHHGPAIVGAMFSAIAAGAVIGASTAGWVRRISRQGLAVLVAVAIWGGCISLFGLVHSIGLAFVLLAGAGAADVISAVFRGTILQTTVTDAYRGRLTAIHILVVTGGPRLGDLEAGLVASAFTPTISVVSGGLACIAGVFVISALMPQFAAYREGDPPG